MPGSILQIHSVNGEPMLYFGGFSSKYIEQANLLPSAINTLFITIGRPVISLKPEGAKLLAEYFQFLIKLYDFFDESTRKGITPHLYNNIHTGIAAMYNNQLQNTKEYSSKSELIYKNFTQLVIQNYNKTRNVAWYAEKLKISNIHLCTTVKKVTGNTCVEIISHMVIMDAKSQLKSTNIPIQEISNSLNFANTSFFGKYFKRYVGMSPLAYRNSG
jgi:AraC family transcriptional activator of pobA